MRYETDMKRFYEISDVIKKELGMRDKSPTKYIYRTLYIGNQVVRLSIQRTIMADVWALVLVSERRKEKQLCYQK